MVCYLWLGSGGFGWGGAGGYGNPSFMLDMIPT